MTPDTRVLNLTRGFRLKRKQAVKAVENCTCAWVEFGVSVRDLNYREVIEARNAQAKEPLGLVYYIEGKDEQLIAKPYFAELPNCVFRRPGHEGELYAERMTAIEANQFARCAARA